MNSVPGTVFVVIPVFNRRDHTLRCLYLLRRQTYAHLRVIVVDDASTDGTAEAIANEFPDVTVLKGNGDLWWSGGMYMGIEHVLRVARAEDFVLMMNNDTEFPADYVETLVSVSREHNAAVGALTVDAADKTKVVDAGEFIDWHAYAFPVKLHVSPGEKFFDGVDVLPGRGSLVPIEMIRQCGNIAKDALPHYIADYEFFCRLKRSRFRLGVTYETWITCDPTATGFNDRGGQLGFAAVLRLMFDRKSMNNLIDHLTFVRLSAPPHRRGPLVRHLLRGAASLLFMRTSLVHIASPLARAARFVGSPYYVRRQDIQAEGLSPELLVARGILQPWVLKDCYLFARSRRELQGEGLGVARLHTKANRLWHKVARLIATRKKLRQLVENETRTRGIPRSV